MTGVQTCALPICSNECVQKSEKDITIVSADKADINTLIDALEAATGMEIASLA